MSWDAGAIVGTMGLNINEYAHGMLEAEGIAHLFPAVVTEFLENPLIAFMEIAKEAAHFVGESVEQMAETFHHVGLAAANAGVSVEFMSGVGAVAKTAGLGVDELAMSFKFLENRAANAMEGVPGAAKGFADLGISVEEVGKLMKEPEQLFYRVAEGIAGIQEPAARTQAATDLMSRAGSQMISLFAKGPDAIKNLAAELTALGGGVNEAEEGMGANFGLLEAKFSAAWMGIKKAVAEPILQALVDNAGSLTEGLKDVTTWLRDGVAGAMNVLKPIASGVWDVFKGIGSVIGPVLIPLFEVLVPLLRIAAEAMGGILHAAGSVLGGFGRIVSEITQDTGIASTAAQVYQTGKNNYDEAGTQINIEHVDFGQVDTERASEQIAGALGPQLRKARIEQFKALGGAAQHSNVSHAIGGKGPAHYQAGV